MQPQRFADAVGTRRSKPLFPGAGYKPATRLFTEQRWLAHRIDELNGEVMLSLVRALDKQMNNTSVILLMRAGSKSLLFPGDAQIENWQYALQSPMAPLLADVDLYKVGHHGSRNATPRSMWNKFTKRGGASKQNRMTSVLSTKHGKHGSVARRALRSHAKRWSPSSRRSRISFPPRSWRRASLSRPSYSISGLRAPARGDT